MRAEFWEPLVQSWNTPEWKAKSSQNTSNRAKFVGGKHTLGSQTYATLKLKADEKLGRPATVDELWMQSHAKKGTRPLDRLLRRERGEGSKEPEEINFQDNVEWVDAKAKESFKSYQKYVMEKYGDNTSKQPLFDLDTWIQAGKKKGRFDISDPQVLMTDQSLLYVADKIRINCATRKTTSQPCYFLKNFTLIQLYVFGKT
ncbi:hypothetical protein R6Q59_007838 [Mikania micrantha]